MREPKRRAEAPPWMVLACMLSGIAAFVVTMAVCVLVSAL